MPMPSKGELSLMDKRTQERLNEAFVREKSYDYFDELRSLSGLSKEERVTHWKGWIDTNYSDEKSEGLRRMFSPLVGYNALINVFIDSMLSLNMAAVGPEVVTLKQVVINQRRDFINEVLKENPDLVLPDKKVYRWSLDEEDFLSTRIGEGMDWRDAYTEYTSHAITSGFDYRLTKEQEKKGVKMFKIKLTRSKKAFSSKWLRMVREVRKGGI